MNTQDRCPHHNAFFDGHARAIIARSPDLMLRAYLDASEPVVDFLKQWTQATGCTRMMSARAMRDYCDDPRQHQVARNHALVSKIAFPEGNGQLFFEVDPDKGVMPQAAEPIHPRFAVRLIVPWSTAAANNGVRTLGYLIDWEANRDNSSLQEDKLTIHCTYLAQIQRRYGNTHFLKQTIWLTPHGRVILCNATVFNTNSRPSMGTPRYSMIGVYDLENTSTNRAVAAMQRKNPQQLLCRVQENRADIPSINAPSSTVVSSAWHRSYPSKIVVYAQKFVKQGYEIDEDPVKGTRSYYPNPGVGDPSGILFRAVSHPKEDIDGIPFLRGNLMAQFGQDRFGIKADNPRVSWSMPYAVLDKIQERWGPISDSVPKTFGDVSSVLLRFYPKYVELINNELAFAPDRFEPFLQH